MKIVGRVAYAILAVFVFWFAIDYARGRMEFRYFSDKGEEAITLGDDAFFYGGGRDYSNETILFEIDTNGYRIAIYEVADATLTDDALNVETYVYGLLFSDADLEDIYEISFVSSTSTIQTTFVLFQPYLNVGMMVNEDSNQYGILSSKLLAKNFDTIILSDETGKELANVDFSIQSSQFILEKELNTFYNDNQTLPLNQLTSIGIYPRFTHSLEPYMNILYLSLGVYVVAVAFSFYVLFVLRKKFMGKKNPSVYFKKEQYKYKETDVTEKLESREEIK